MKKLYAFFLIILFYNICHVFNVLCNMTEESLEKNNFKITCSLSEAQNNTQVTFDKYKTITGITKQDCIIKIINNVMIDNEQVILQEYEFLVGPSGVFSKDIYLKVGCNNIQIICIKNEECTSKEYIIKRLRSEIKEEIENKNIIIPNKRINL